MLPGSAGTRRGLEGREPLVFVPDAVVAGEFGGGPGAGFWVGGSGRGGEDEGEVDIGAAGHRRVQPLPVLAAGDQRDAGVHGGALGGVPGDRVGEIGCLVAVITEGLSGEPALAGGRVGVEQAADHDAAAGDGLDPQDVAVGQGPAGLARFEVVVVGPADDQAPGGGLGAVGDPDGAACVDEAEVDEVVADPGGQFAAAGPVRGHQHDGAAGEVGGEVGAGGLVGGVVGRGAADAAVLVVLVQRGGVPVAQAEGGGAFPGSCEPDGFGELDVAEPVGEAGATLVFPQGGVQDRDGLGEGDGDVVVGGGLPGGLGGFSFEFDEPFGGGVRFGGREPGEMVGEGRVAAAGSAESGSGSWVGCR